MESSIRGGIVTGIYIRGHQVIFRPSPLALQGGNHKLQLSIAIAANTVTMSYQLQIKPIV